MNKLEYEKQFSLPTNKKVSASCVVAQYRELPFTRPETVLGKREVELEVQRKCVRYAEYLPVAESAARGDFVNLDFQGYLNGEPFDDGKIEGFDLQLGSNTFVPGFEDQLVNRSAGESFEISVTFPEEYPAEELRGQKCTFQITLNEVRHLTVPAPSDEIARKEGFADLNEMTEAVRQQRIRLHRNKENEKLEEQLLDQVIDSAEAVIAEPLVEFMMAQLKKQLERKLAASRITIEKHLSRNNMTEEELEEQLRQRADRAITKQLVVDGIIEKEKLEPTAQEVETALDEYVKAAPRPGSRQKSPQVRALIREHISIRKVGRFLLEHAVEV